MSLCWDDPSYSGMIVFKFGWFFQWWDECLYVGLILLIVG